MMTTTTTGDDNGDLQKFCREESSSRFFTLIKYFEQDYDNVEQEVGDDENQP